MPRAEPSRARGSETALARQAWVVALVLPCSSERVTCLHPISEGRVAGVSNRAGTSDEVMRGKSLDERAHACMHMNYATAFNQLCGEGVLPHQAEGGARARVTLAGRSGGWPPLWSLGPSLGLAFGCWPVWNLCIADIYKVVPCDSFPIDLQSIATPAAVPWACRPRGRVGGTLRHVPLVGCRAVRLALGL